MPEVSLHNDAILVELMRQGLRAQMGGELPLAREAYLRVLARDPEQADAWCNLGAVLRELGCLDQALAANRKAVDLAPDNPPALVNLGRILALTGDVESAFAEVRRAQALAPEDPVVLSTLADLHHRSDDDEAALALHWAAYELAPEIPELGLNLGYGLMRLGHLQEAEEALMQTVRRVPGHPRARWNLAYTRLLRGKWQEAWPFFHARLQVPEAAENRRTFAQPAWHGEPFQGRTLLVWGEQGFGDAIMAMRLLPRVKALGGQLLVLTYPQLLPLLQGMPPVDGWIAEGDPLPPFDLQAPLLELPALLGLSPENLEGEPYLHPPQATLPTRELVRCLASSKGGRRIGLAWRGQARHVEDQRRSLDPGRLACFSHATDVQWFSFQVPPGTLPPLDGVIDLGPHLRHFGDTAWALQAMDAVITVDTAMAHLAGAMGVPTHVLVPYFPDWRWGFSGMSTPWYASVRLHRQHRPGDWFAPLQEVLEVLA